MTWTDEENEYLTNYCMLKTVKELAKELVGRSEKAVSAQLNRRKLKYKKSIVMRDWMPGERAYLAENCKETPVSVMAEYLDRTVSSVRGALKKWGMEYKRVAGRPRSNGHSRFSSPVTMPLEPDDPFLWKVAADYERSGMPYLIAWGDDATVMLYSQPCAYKGKKEPPVEKWLKVYKHPLYGTAIVIHESKLNGTVDALAAAAR